MITLVPGSIVAGVLVTRRNNYRWAIWSGWVLTTLACAMTVAWRYNSATGFWVVSLIIIGFGHGGILNAQNFASQAMCKPGEEGAAAAMYGFLRQFGMSLGVGIGGSTFQNVMALRLRWLGLDDDIARNAEALLGQIVRQPDSDFKSKVLDAYSYGFLGVFGLYLALSSAAFIVSLLIRNYDMNKKLDSGHLLTESKVSGMIRRRLTQTKEIAVSDVENGGLNGDRIPEVSASSSTTC